ncbi:hypothetical protein CBFG_02840 [Clostridiales bacterium 1_7_47FAA]|nr:hypothetical protein CBFG_02840 [Clostridiales bacterium 1_7_47FAA]
MVCGENRQRRGAYSRKHTLLIKNHSVIILLGAVIPVTVHGKCSNQAHDFPPSNI